MITATAKWLENVRIVDNSRGHSVVYDSPIQQGGMA